MDRRTIGVTFQETTGAHAVPEGFPEGTRSWEATVRFDGSEETFDYHTGPAIDAPDKNGLLSCLALDAESADETFADWCADYGYDEDSRKAYATWEACKVNAEKLRELFGSSYGAFLATEWDA